MRLNSILEAIGKTPLVRLHKAHKPLQCQVWAKCEFLNPAGSIKDRIGLAMIEAAEKQGRIRPGDTLIEPSSGNTGIGLALAGAIKGYKVIITMPEKMSQEKVLVLESLGATIFRTPTDAAHDAPESHISLARRLAQELPRAHILDQYANAANPDCHAQTTAAEILADLPGSIDMAVIGAGTGGTITGCARTLKAAHPHCHVVGVDPYGSILAGPGPVHSYQVEGIGYDFVPQVLNHHLVDSWVRISDEDAFLAARRLIRDEGLLVGGSSGAALAGALKAATELPPSANLVLILPDSLRNYMSKFLNPSWRLHYQFNQEL